MNKNITQIADKAINLVKDLLEKTPKKANDLKFPKKRGVYLIYDLTEKRPSKKGVIYIGQGIIKNRIPHTHLLREQHPSPVRKKLMKRKKMTESEDMRKYVEKNCRFAFDDEIEEKVMCLLVERLLIAFLKAKDEPLYNS